MTTRSRVPLAPGSLLALSALALIYSLSPWNHETRAAMEQPDITAIQNSMAGAHSIVVATARSVQSAWEDNEYGDRIIQSTVMLEVTETLKGRPERSRWLRVEGGTVDGVTLEVSGEPEVRVGDRAVFMLNDAGPNRDRLHPVHESVLPLDDQDFVRGTSLHLEDVRRHARGLGR